MIATFFSRGRKQHAKRMRVATRRRSADLQRGFGGERLEDRRLLANTVGVTINNVAEAFGGHTLFAPSASTTTYLIVVPDTVPADVRAIAGDWDGDGRDTIGFVDPVTRDWRLANRLDGTDADLLVFRWALPAGWQPLTGNWDGRGEGGHAAAEGIHGEKVPCRVVIQETAPSRLQPKTILESALATAHK